MSETSKVLFIINRYSGVTYRDELQEKISSYCSNLNLDCTIEFTKRPGHATELAREAINKKYKIVFAVGGDGTVNEVSKGLLHSDIPLGIIPIGSGNGLARHLKIPLSIEKALNLLHSQKTISIDTFSVNGRFSVNVSGIGYDGYIAELFGQNGKRGFFTYIKLVVTNFNKFNEFEYKLEADNLSVKNSAFIISCANSSQFGNNAIIAPHASLSDELLDICMIKKMSLIQGLFIVMSLFRGNIHQSKHATIEKVREFQLRTNKPVPYHIDGEAAGSASEFNVKIDPLSLLIRVPTESQFI